MADENNPPPVNYEISHARRGKALIFNISQFEHSMRKPFKRSKRAVTVDHARMLQGLTAMNFEIERISQGGRYPSGKRPAGWVSKEFILNKLATVYPTEAGSEVVVADVDCLLIVFLTLGDQNRICASDSMITKEELQQPLLATTCPALAGKPKLFILRTDTTNLQSTMADDDSHGPKTPLYIPAEADFHFFWCNMAENKYYYDGKENHGDLFVRIMANEMEELAKRIEKGKQEGGDRGDGLGQEDSGGYDWVDIYREVTRKVARQLAMKYPNTLEEELKILPLQEDSLTRAFLLKA